MALTSAADLRRKVVERSDLHRRIRDRWGSKGPYLLLALVAWIPPLLTRPGVISADTKVYLYLDPGRFLQSAVTMWDPDVAMGTVTHQTIGYLFPMGPFFWLTKAIGLPTWAAQRLWLGLLLFLAGAGLVYLLRALRWQGPGVLVAALLYVLSPYVLNYFVWSSVITLPWAGLPWLLAFLIRSVRHGGWRDPALFAFWMAFVGGVNATALVLVLAGLVLWLPFAVWVHREASLRQAIQAVLRIGVLTFLTATWWLSGLWAQGRYGINVLQYTETVKTVAAVSSTPEVLRGLGYWYFYGSDKFDVFVDASRAYTQHLWLIALSFVVPTIGLLGAAVARFRERAYFLALLIVGIILSVGAYPYDGHTLVPRLIRDFLTSSQAGSAMRSMPRAVPLVVLALAVLCGAGITALHERLSAKANRLDRRVLAVAGGVAVLALANFWPGLSGGMVTNNQVRPGEPPAYWKADAKALDAGPHDTRVFEIPGINFATYRWNGKYAVAVDPITPGLITRPYVAREQVPFGTPQSADLLDAFDTKMQEQVLAPTAVAPISRFMSAGVLNLRNDLVYERYNTLRPRQTWALVRAAPGLGTPRGFGGNAPYRPDPRYPLLDEAELSAPPDAPNPPKLAIVPVEGTPPIVHASPTDSPVILAGDGSGLVDTSGAGLLDGHELVLYSGSFAKQPKQLDKAINAGAALVVTDTNRRAAHRWGTVKDTTGYTEQAGETPLRNDPGDQRLDVFPGSGDAQRTVTEQRGGIQAHATGYGNPVSYTPEDRAANAVDGDPLTAWRAGAFSPVRGEKLVLDFAKPQTADQIFLQQPQTGVRNRFVTEVKLSFDDGSSQTLTLDDSSRGPGQTIHFPRHTFRQASLEVVGDSYGRHVNYPGQSAVGFAEVRLGTHMPQLHEYVRLPTDLLHAAGAANTSHPLALVMTRERVTDVNAVRRDPEVSLSRTWSLPTSRAFGISGKIRLGDASSPRAVDRVLGIPDAAHLGVDASDSRRLGGPQASRATSAIDGRPDTAWSTGFVSSVGDWSQYRTAAPVTFDHLDLQVWADGRHSVPTKLQVTADGASVNADIPPIDDGSSPNAVRTVRVKLPHAVTGSTIRLTIAGTRPVMTNDWYSQMPIEMPVAIAEWGVPGLRAPPPPAVLDPACRRGLLKIDGVDVPISIRGTSRDALAGKQLPFVACVPSSGLPLPKGDQTLSTAAPYNSGIDVDQVVLRSAAGGKGDLRTGLIDPAPGGSRAGVRRGSAPASGAHVDVRHKDRTSFDLRVTNVDRSQWLVLGQSYNEGWHATVDGHDLGPPTLVNGYANAWRIGPGTSGPGHGGTVTVHLRWTPQRVVNIALWISAVGGLLVLVLILWPMRHRLAPVAGEERARAERNPSVPRAASLVRFIRYGGPEPRLRDAAIAVVALGVATGIVVGPIAGAVVAAVVALCARERRARPLLTVAGPLCLLATAGYYVVEQWQHRYITDFDWPIFFAQVHELAWMAVVLVAADAVLDRLWLRRWWPTDDSPA